MKSLTDKMNQTEGIVSHFEDKIEVMDQISRECNYFKSLNTQEI